MNSPQVFSPQQEERAQIFDFGSRRPFNWADFQSTPFYFLREEAWGFGEFGRFLLRELNKGFSYNGGDIRVSQDGVFTLGVSFSPISQLGPPF